MQVQFRIKNAQTKVGQSVFVVGSLDCLGRWKPNAAKPMRTDKKLYPKWRGKDFAVVKSMAEAKKIEYKYIINNVNEADQVTWEDGNNRALDLSAVFDQFKGQDKVVVVEDESFNKSSKPSKVYPVAVSELENPSNPHQMN